MASKLHLNLHEISAESADSVEIFCSTPKTPKSSEFCSHSTSDNKPPPSPKTPSNIITSTPRAPRKNFLDKWNFRTLDEEDSPRSDILVSPRLEVFPKNFSSISPIGFDVQRTPTPSEIYDLNDFPKAPLWDSPDSPKDLSDTSKLVRDLDKLHMNSPKTPSRPGKASTQGISPNYNAFNGVPNRSNEDSFTGSVHDVTHPSFSSSPSGSNSVSMVISPKSDVPSASPLSSMMDVSVYEPAESRVLTPRNIRRNLQQHVNVPKFHFPQGKPLSHMENDAALRRALDVFKKLPEQKAVKKDLGDVLRAAGLPYYWKAPAHYAITKAEKDVPISTTDFSAWWRNMTHIAHDEAARFVYILTCGKRDFLERDDLSNLVYDVIWTHPGLTFYHEAEEFHKHYVNIVITSIFWYVNRSWSGKITASELRRSDFLEKLHYLDHEDDINKETKYFSYEHFYVVYCKFWELDHEHSMAIAKEDLLTHDEHALTPLVVNRIFSGAVTPGRKKGQMETIGLAEFAMFLMADEDKRNPTSIEYWFRICDLDGDGILTLYEMELFYKQIVEKMEAEKIETMKFPDVVCNLFDIVSPRSKVGFTLTDLKKTALAYRVFNTFVNVRKFFAQETNEQEKPIMKNDEGRELTDWERYCDEEYETLMNEDEVDECHSVNLDEEDSRNNSFRDLL